jgi:hypothetical protein
MRAREQYLDGIRRGRGLLCPGGGPVMAASARRTPRYVRGAVMAWTGATTCTLSQAPNSQPRLEDGRTSSATATRSTVTTVIARTCSTRSGAKAILGAVRSTVIARMAMIRITPQRFRRHSP